MNKHSKNYTIKQRIEMMKKASNCNDLFKKIFRKKGKKKILNSLIVPKNLKWGLFGWVSFNIHSVAKYEKNEKGPFADN